MSIIRDIFNVRQLRSDLDFEKSWSQHILGEAVRRQETNRALRSVVDEKNLRITRLESALNQFADTKNWTEVTLVYCTKDRFYNDQIAFGWMKAFETPVNPIDLAKNALSHDTPQNATSCQETPAQ